jgi:4-hydroxy-2-oxoheptanedioate aldolase
MGLVASELSLRERIVSGQSPLMGMSVGTLSPAAVEMAAYAGADFVWLDLEHGPVDYMTAEHLCRAAEARGVLPLLRIQDDSRTAVLRALEVGARLVVIPQVHTAEQAAAIASHGKFAPVGQRGFNTGTKGLWYGSRGATMQEIFALANAETCLLPQVESVEAVHNADEILSVRGIDGLLIGPGDLSASMGIVGQWESEELLTTVEGIFALCGEHSKIAAAVCPTAAMGRRLKAAGGHILNTCGDLGLIRQGLAARLGEIRGD